MNTEEKIGKTDEKETFPGLIEDCAVCRKKPQKHEIDYVDCGEIKVNHNSEVSQPDCNTNKLCGGGDISG